MRYFLYLLYLHLFLDLGLFMLCLCDLFFIFIFIFIMIDCIILWIQTHLFFCSFFRICSIISYHFWMITWMKRVNNFQIAKVEPQGAASLLLDFWPISTWRFLWAWCFVFYKPYKKTCNCFLKWFWMTACGFAV